jgi:TPR repeat protein
VQYQQARLHPEIDVWIHDCAKFTSEGPLKETSFQAHPNLWQLHPRQLNAEPPVYKFSTGQFIPAFFEGSPFPVPTLMVRRAYMIRIGGWNPALRRCGEDIEFATRVAAESPVGYIDLPLAEVRRGHGGNISADPLKTYEDVAQNFEECIAGYAPALRSTVQRGLGKFYARLGWMCFDKRLFKKAATYYQQALRHGQLSPAVLLKFGLATLRK